MAKKKRNESSDSDAPLDFEAALEEVEKVVNELESGDLGLSESLAQYERGIEKIKQCHQVLVRAEKRIAVLTSVDEDGTASLEPVDTDDSQKGPLGEGPSQAKRSIAKQRRPPVSDVDDSEGLF